MKTRLSQFMTMVAVALLAAVAIWHTAPAVAQESARQQQQNQSFIGNGVSARGNRVLQVGSMGTMSAAVTGALAEVVAAPAAGLSTYLVRIWVEKAVGTTGAIDIKYGTGTNCGTGTTTLFSLAANAANPIPLGNYDVGIAVPAAKALCAMTEAAGTQVRLVTN